MTDAAARRRLAEAALEAPRRCDEDRDHRRHRRVRTRPRGADSRARRGGRSARATRRAQPRSRLSSASRERATRTRSTAPTWSCSPCARTPRWRRRAASRRCSGRRRPARQRPHVHRPRSSPGRQSYSLAEHVDRIVEGPVAAGLQTLAAAHLTQASRRTRTSSSAATTRARRIPRWSSPAASSPAERSTPAPWRTLGRWRDDGGDPQRQPPLQGARRDQARRPPVTITVLPVEGIPEVRAETTSPR